MPLFPNVLHDENCCQNIDRIFPTGQRAVNNLVKHLKEEKAVQRVIVFGSALEGRFDPYYNNSDIDIYVDATDDWTPPGKMFIDLEIPVDIITNSWQGTDIMQDIMQKGVIVYERHTVSKS